MTFPTDKLYGPQDVADTLAYIGLNMVLKVPHKKLQKNIRPVLVNVQASHTQKVLESKSVLCLAHFPWIARIGHLKVSFFLLFLG